MSLQQFLPDGLPETPEKNVHHKLLQDIVMAVTVFAPGRVGLSCGINLKLRKQQMKKIHHFEKVYIFDCELNNLLK